MCTDCNEITIPTGASGDRGPQGPAGADGLNGSAGLDGTNGTTIINSYNSTTGTAITATLTETTLYTYNIPANTLSTDGDELELVCFLNYTNSTAVTMRFKLGSKIYSKVLQNIVPEDYLFRIKISRIGTTSQFWLIEGDQQTSVLNQNTLTTTTSTVDLSTILAFEITAENSVATANTIVLKKATLYKYKK